MLVLLQYLSGLFLGWGLGANDTANTFGTAVSSRMVSYRLAVIIAAAGVMLGAIAQGEAGIHTLSEELRQSSGGEAVGDARVVAIVISLAAALTMLALTGLRLPASTSQAVVGAIVGVGILRQEINYHALGKVVACWLGTPLGGAFFTVVLYHLLRRPLQRWRPGVFTYDPIMAILLILAGAYGAYALGANNVANVAAVFVGEGMMTARQAAVFGGIAIAIGTVTYSRPVMMTVGRDIVRLDAFTALVTVLAHALTVHCYAMIGVPVSTSQAIVGAVLGIALVKGVQTVNLRTLAKVSVGWVATPVVAGVVAIIIFLLARISVKF